MICDCLTGAATKGRSGYHLREDGIWVHATCERPSRLYLKGFLEDMPTHLNLLQGGPLHNTMLTNAELLDRKSITLMPDGETILKHVDRYRWTPDTIVGSESGRTARVWRWRESE